jgi:hypothetical protein
MYIDFYFKLTIDTQNNYYDKACNVDPLQLRDKISRSICDVWNGSVQVGENMDRTATQRMRHNGALLIWWSNNPALFTKSQCSECSVCISLSRVNIIDHSDIRWSNIQHRTCHMTLNIYRYVMWSRSAGCPNTLLTQCVMSVTCKCTCQWLWLNKCVNGQSWHFRVWYFVPSMHFSLTLIWWID